LAIGAIEKNIAQKRKGLTGCWIWTDYARYSSAQSWVGHIGAAPGPAAGLTENKKSSSSFKAKMKTYPL